MYLTPFFNNQIRGLYIMWEIDIIINYKYRKYLMYIKENITNSKNYSKKGVFAIIKMDNNAILSIAMLDATEELKQEIRVWIAECIVFSEKESYIRNKKILPNTTFRNAFLKALIMVDISSDIDIVAKEINLCDKSINLHSLYKFRLKFLEDRWEKSLQALFPDKKELTSDKLMDILKNIVASNRKSVEVVIKKRDNKFVIEAINDDIYITASDEADVIANLILLSPYAIHNESANEYCSDSLILIEYLFSNIACTN